MNGRIYVTGGKGIEMDVLSTGEVLDLQTMRWGALPDMGTSRALHGKLRKWMCDSNMEVLHPRCWYA